MTLNGLKYILYNLTKVTIFILLRRATCIGTYNVWVYLINEKKLTWKSLTKSIAYNLVPICVKSSRTFIFQQISK